MTDGAFFDFLPSVLKPDEKVFERFETPTE
jgi:hypothetical protein